MFELIFIGSFVLYIIGIFLTNDYLQRHYSGPLENALLSIIFPMTWIIFGITRILRMFKK